MKVLIIGGGGREHAICWKLAQSARKPTILCAPGNAGTEGLAENVDLRPDHIDGLLQFARKRAVDLTVVGPEEPLCAGIVDRFQAAGLRIFGPTAAAARLEGDKAYAKELMREAGVPTAEARIFGPTDQELIQGRQPGGMDAAVRRRIQTGYDMARDYVLSRDEGVVVKAAGLAKGKGVFVHPDPSEALRTLEELMVDETLGEAGQRVVVEELLIGREVSVMALVDGRTIYMLEPVSDYKRAGDGDTGPNTGGMGAYCPSDGISDTDYAVIQRDILVPVIDALGREDVVYRGVLYAGLMMTAAGPKVLEFNCRFGDPETQPVLMRLESDLLEIMGATVDGTLDRMELCWRPEPAVCVVMASGGYPGAYPKGVPIQGLDLASTAQDVVVFHAGTARRDDQVVTDGGRVLGVTALGTSMEAARARAYEAVERISFAGAQFRRDIGERAVRK